MYVYIFLTASFYQIKMCYIFKMQFEGYFIKFYSHYNFWPVDEGYMETLGIRDGNTAK